MPYPRPVGTLPGPRTIADLPDGRPIAALDAARLVTPLPPGSIYPRAHMAIDGRPEGFDWIERPGQIRTITFTFPDDQTGATFELRITGLSPIACAVLAEVVSADVTIPPAGVYAAVLWNTGTGQEIVPGRLTSTRDPRRRPPLDELDDDPLAVTIQYGTGQNVNITIIGESGGGPGPGGGTGYVHEQGTPSTTWVINHSLGFRPGGLVVVDSGGSINEPASIVHNSVNQMTVTFLFPFGGTAYVS